MRYEYLRTRQNHTIRAEARELRKRRATLKNAWKAQKKRADQLEKTVHEQKEKIKSLAQENNERQKENAELKSRLGLEIDKAKKYAGMQKVLLSSQT